VCPDNEGFCDELNFSCFLRCYGANNHHNVTLLSTLFGLFSLKRLVVRQVPWFCTTGTGRAFFHTILLKKTE
jgi:hypothetical protein